MEELSTPVPGEEIFAFASPYARSFGVQLYTVLAGVLLGWYWGVTGGNVGVTCGLLGCY